MLTFGSLFAGIGGFDLGAERAGMKCIFQVEINEQCQSVLARHWPDVPKHKDVTTFHATASIRPDLICGGFPCQDLSVAGKRAGLAGKRSGLFYEFMRVVSKFAPRWVVIENVPGLLSSNGARDMGAVLWTLGQLGYGWAYRVLDAQWFGVAQRRRRVFIVGCLGDGRRAAEVLFESDCLPWDSPPSREAGTRDAHRIARGTGSSGYRYDANGEDFVTGTLNAHSKEHGHCMSSQQAAECGQLVATLNSGGNNGGFRTEPGEHCVVHTLRGEGFDASEDGTGRGTPLVAAYQCHGTNVGPMGTLRKGDGNVQSGVPFVAFQTRIARNGRGQPKEITDALTSADGGTHADSKPHVAGSFGVRRLMPIECERLQSFPDNWTALGHDGKAMSDSARYRMLGNAVCVNVASWIGKRIVDVEQLQKVRRTATTAEVRSLEMSPVRQ